jgi:hypothetical protein
MALSLSLVISLSVLSRLGGVGSGAAVKMSLEVEEKLNKIISCQTCVKYFNQIARCLSSSI